MERRMWVNEFRTEHGLGAFLAYLFTRAVIIAGRPTATNFRWQMSPCLSVNLVSSAADCILVRALLVVHTVDGQRGLGHQAVPLATAGHLTIDIWSTKRACHCVLNEFGASLALSHLCCANTRRHLSEDCLPCTVVGGRSS